MSLHRRDGGRYVPRWRVRAAADTALMLTTLFAVLVTLNLDNMPDGLGGFLSLRITIKNIVILAVLAGVWPLVFHACGVYRRVRRSQEAARIVIACALTSWMAMLFSVTSLSGRFSTSSVVAFWVCSTLSLIAARVVRHYHTTLSPRAQRVVIVGLGPRGRAVFQELQGAERKYEVLGFVDTLEHVPTHGEWAGRVLSTIGDLERVLMREPVDEVFITLPVASHYREIRRVLEICERGGVQTKYRADIVDSQLAWPSYDDADGTPLVTMHVVAADSRLVLKRLIDIVGATAALIVLGPLMIAIAILVKTTSPGPILYRQERCGLNKRIFRMWKFRTMVQGAEQQQDALEERNEMDGPVFKIRSDPRITRLGRILRRTSLDELPQFVQVLTGHMSLVGPRPLPLRDVTRFTRPGDMRRFSVRPGLTCLWQISGRNNLGFNEWIRLDLTYIDFWSLVLDFRILARTIPAVLRGVGAG
jgi:exopolysaccharide biosynthesis polyprenyl glycosylphosphotransferase